MNIAKGVTVCTVKDFNNVSGQTIGQMKHFSLLLQSFLSGALHFSCYTEMFIIFDLKTNKEKPFSYSHSGLIFIAEYLEIWHWL